MFMSTVRQVKLEVRPLFLPQLVQLTSLLKPGLSHIKASTAYIIKFVGFVYFHLKASSCSILRIVDNK